MINGHGNNIYSFGAKSIEIDFSSNIAFNNKSQQICDYLSTVLQSISDYPDPEATALTDALANHLSVADNELLVTNGSAEAFYLIAHHLKRVGSSNTAIVIPSFAEYEDSCRIYNHELNYISFDELLTADLSSYGSLWLGLPNNPDGRRVEYTQIRALAAKYPKCYFVVDRAYNELSGLVERSWELMDNIIITDSFTKSYGIPGLRLGYIYAKSDLIAAITSISLPWSVNSLSQLAGLYIIEHHSELQLDRAELIGESKYLQQEISKLENYRVTPSDCNFFLVEILTESNASDLRDYLVENHGILIRDCSNFRGLSPKHFRVAAHSREACDRLILALKKWI